MANASVKVSGFRDLDKQLAKLAGGIPQDRLRTQLHHAAEIIADEQRRLVPVRTGRLRDSIKVTDDREGRLYGKQTVGEMDVYIGPVGSTEDGDVFYAQYVEFGTIHTRAHPFLRPAFAAKREAAQEDLTNSLASDIIGLTR